MRYFKTLEDRENCATLARRSAYEVLMRLDAYVGSEADNDTPEVREFRRQYVSDVANIVFGEVVLPLVTKSDLEEDGAIVFDLQAPDQERTELPVFFQEAHRLAYLCEKIEAYVSLHHELYEHEERHVLALIRKSEKALDENDNETIVRNCKELELWLPHVQPGARFFRGDPVARAQYEEWRENLPRETIEQFEDMQERWERVQAVTKGAYGEPDEYRDAIRKLEDEEEELVRRLHDVQARIEELTGKLK